MICCFLRSGTDLDKKTNFIGTFFMNNYVEINPVSRKHGTMTDCEGFPLVISFIFEITVIRHVFVTGTKFFTREKLQ